MEKEYTSLRDEIMKWQDRRIVFSQLALTLVIAYIGYMMSKDLARNTWQEVSILPLLVLAVAMHVSRWFELFQLRAAAYLVVYHNSNWEKNVGEIHFSNGLDKIGYNKSMAFFYLLIAVFSTFMFIQKYPHPFYSRQSISFGICSLMFVIVFVSLFTFDTRLEKEKLVKKWSKIKEG